MMKYIILVCAVLSTSAHAECNTQSGTYAGFGYARDLHSDAAYPFRGHLYGGYKLCNGLQIELRHTSALGSNDGYDVTGDNENDIRTSENSIGAYYTVWFK